MGLLQRIMGEDRSRAERRSDKAARREFEGETREGIPSADDPSVQYEPQYEDSLNERFQLGQSQEAQAAADPRDLRAQREALGYFQGVNRAGGWTPLEAMQLQSAGLEAAQLERGQREALQQQAAARGMAGGGQELMGSLAAQQGGANRAHDWATQIATEGQRRAYEAAQQAGALSSAMRGQGFDETRARGAAADEFTRSNVDYARGSEARNVERTNESRRRQADLPLDIAATRMGMVRRDDEQDEREAQTQKAIWEGAIGGIYNVGTGIAGAARSRK